MVASHEDDAATADVRALARSIATSVASEHADDVDRTGRWPVESMRTLASEGLLGLHVDRELGGRGLGLQALAAVTEELGYACGSTGLVFGMHSIATKVLSVKPTEDQCRRILAPIAEGTHVSGLALAEPGSGVHFYLPGTTFRRTDDTFVVNGRKSFVTSGGEADSYVISVVAEGALADPGTFSCLLLERDTEGLSWQQPWDGFGMRGNGSRGLALEEARVPAANLLGTEGDETWYVFEIIAPYFIVAMAGTYLGIARSALDVAVEHLRKRTYTHTGGRPGAEDLVTHGLGRLWAVVERSRQLLAHAARLGDAGDPQARLALFACKAEIADAAVEVANEAMTLTGGIAYGGNSRLSRALRDARASHVMSPTTELLRTWLGRSLLDLPLL